MTKMNLKKIVKLMDLAKDSLEIKRKVLDKLMDHNLYPVSKIYLEPIKEHHGSCWLIIFLLSVLE